MIKNSFLGGCDCDDDGDEQQECGDASLESITSPISNQRCHLRIMTSIVEPQSDVIINKTNAKNVGFFRHKYFLLACVYVSNCLCKLLRNTSTFVRDTYVYGVLNIRVQCTVLVYTTVEKHSFDITVNAKVSFFTHRAMLRPFMHAHYEFYRHFLSAQKRTHVRYSIVPTF